MFYDVTFEQLERLFPGRSGDVMALCQLTSDNWETPNAINWSARKTDANRWWDVVSLSYGYHRIDWKNDRIVRLEVTYPILINIQAVSSLTELKLLGVDSEVEDLRPLIQLKQLEALRINCKKVKSLEPLLMLPRLRILQVINAKPEDLEVISKLRNLERLEVIGSTLEDLNLLAGMNLLVRVGFEECELKNQDLSVFTTLPKLDEISFRDTSITDVSRLTEVPALRRVNLWSVPTAQIEPLVACLRLNLVVTDQTRDVIRL